MKTQPINVINLYLEPSEFPTVVQVTEARPKDSLSATQPLEAVTDTLKNATKEVYPDLPPGSLQIRKTEAFIHYKIITLSTPG